VGGAAQALFAANSKRMGLFVQNISAGDLWINELAQRRWLRSRASRSRPAPPSRRPELVAPSRGVDLGRHAARPSSRASTNILLTRKQ
jgi:hypothetical protein